PIDQMLACRAAGLGADELSLLTLLRSQRLVRGTGPSGEGVVPYHCRVRETVAAHVPAELLPDVHRRLALALEAAGEAAAEALAIHFRGAGETRRSSGYYARAAAQASEALAFDRAVELYRLAQECGPADGAESRRLWASLGEALANAGRSAE